MNSINSLNLQVVNQAQGNVNSKESTAKNGDFFAQILQLLAGNGSDEMSGLEEMLLGMKSNADENIDDKELQELIASMLGNGAQNLGMLGSYGNSDLQSQLFNSQNYLLNNVGSGENLPQDLAMGSLNGNNLQNAFQGFMMQGNSTQDDPFLSNMNGAQNPNYANELLRQMTLVNSAQEMVKSGSLSNLSESDTMSAVTAMISGNYGKVNDIISQAGRTQSLEQLANGQANNSVIDVDVISSVENSDKSASQNLLEGKMNFQNAVSQAQRLMQKGKASDEISSYDMAAQAVTNQEAKTNEVQEVAPVKITDIRQLDMDDLIEKLKNGADNGNFITEKEFTVRLKPEGLGDVTVKIIKEQNQMVMSIVAASEQTARLLNENLLTLKDNLQTFNVNVNDVLTQQQNQSNMQNNQNQFDQNNNGTEQNTAIYYDHETEMGEPTPIKMPIYQSALSMDIHA